jgi:hypothetical protein
MSLRRFSIRACAALSTTIEADVWGQGLVQCFGLGLGLQFGDDALGAADVRVLRLQSQLERAQVGAGDFQLLRAVPANGSPEEGADVMATGTAEAVASARLRSSIVSRS